VPSASALSRTSHLLLITRAPRRPPQAGGHGQIKEGKIMRKILSVVLVLLFVTIGYARADSITEDMTKLNAKWDAAINDPNFDALLPMYAADARLMPPGAAPVSGPTAIRDFFAKRGTSVRNHKLELVEILQMGDYAYVTSRFKASLVKGEETTTLSGSTVKLYEHQSNGEWKVKSHIFVRE
jgi:ketosteroid isomerase-like protein